MRTEEYIIILVGVTATGPDVVITYTSDSPLSNVSVRITYNGKTVKTFDQVKSATNGVLTFPVRGLQAGLYSCAILEEGQERDSKEFSIK